jgi:hypothetical protein
MAEAKAKRALKNIDFKHATAHVAMVSKDQNGPANGYDYALILKAGNSGFSQEYIEKIQGVKVTMDLPDFLEKFFGLWEGDAELLAAMLGYVDNDDASETEGPMLDYCKQYVADNLPSFEIMKMAKDAASPELVVSSLDEKQYLRLIKDQAFVEKAFRKKDRQDKKLKTTAEEPSEAKLTKTTETTVSENTIDVQKSLEDTKVLLEKATNELAAMKKAAQDAVIKAKTDKVQALVKDAAQKEILVKAALALSTDEDFNAFVSSLEAINKQVETSVLFKETGATATGEDKSKIQNNGVAELLKAKYGK